MATQGASALNWPALIGPTVGIAVVGLATAGVLWTRHRRRVQRKESPPVMTKLLRPAGYSLQQKIFELNDDWMLMLCGAVASATVAGMCVVAWLQFVGTVARSPVTFGQAVGVFVDHPGLLGFVAMTLAGLVAAWIMTAKVLKITESMRWCRLGLRGEQAVGEALSKSCISKAGYKIFHDVPGDGDWNVDHVAVGPGGIFVIETKARPRRKPKFEQEDDLVVFNGRTLRFPWCSDHKAAGQARRNAYFVWKLIDRPKGLRVRGIVVVPGWRVKARGYCSVRAMRANELIRFLAKQPTRLNDEQVKNAVNQLDGRCRTVEF